MPPPKPEDLLTESGWVRALAGGLVGESDADDLAQEAWVRALVRPPGRRGAELRRWLATVLRNLAWNARRSEAATSSARAPTTAGR